MIQFMRRTLAVFVILILAFSTTVFSEEVAVNMTAIATIESSNNTEAYNERSQARGLYQITPICLADYNQYHKDKIHLNQLFIREYNLEVANWYMNKRIPQLLIHYGLTDTLNNRLIAYNAGISYLIKNKTIPTETSNYIKKYNRLTK